MKRSLSYDAQSYNVLFLIVIDLVEVAVLFCIFLVHFFLEETIKWLKQIQSIKYLIMK